MSIVVNIAFSILVPLFAAAAAFVLPRAGRWLALGAASAVIVGSINIARQVLTGGVYRHQVGGWSAPLGIELRVDGLAALLLLVAALIGTAITLYAPHYFSSADHGQGREPESPACYFWPLWIFLWAALNALFLSADIFNLYVTLELLGFSAVMLVALAGQASAYKAAMRYLLVSLSGSLFYLLGVALIYGNYSSVDLSQLAGMANPDPVTWTALVLMTAGLLMKSALFPMHFWLPPAHANAPAPVSALLSALVIKGSFYILIRLWFEAFSGLGNTQTAQFVGALGGAAIIWGSIQALLQSRLKMLVAYSTVAQVGYLFLVFPLAADRSAGFGAWGGAMILLAAHACAKTSMFLTAGNIMQSAGHDRIRDLDGITHVLPVSVFAFALAGMSLIGLPPSGGFVGKWMLLNTGLAQQLWPWVVLIIIGGLLAAAYVMRVLFHAFTRVAEAQESNPVPCVMEWTAFGLGLIAVCLGFWVRWPIALLGVGAPVAGPVLFGGAVP